jgi:hypothetical protein
MKVLMRLLREPLFHFITIGGLIFAVYAALDRAREAPADVIVIAPERIDQLATEFNAIWKRTPTDDELDSLIEADVREEVYYRDALALGLDRNDVIVRRRMGQKMLFLMDTGAYLRKPAAGDLEAYLAANEDFYRSGLRLALEQVYLGESPPAEAIARSLHGLRSDPPVDPATLGERSFLPAQLGLSPSSAVDGVFGTGFFERLAELSPGQWTGPVVSTYGVHLVRILDHRPARTPPLEEIRDAVLKNWREAQAQEIREQDYAERRKHFVVEIRRTDAQASIAIPATPAENP